MNKKHRKYYAKLMLINTCIFIFVNIVYCVLAYTGAYQAENTQLLKNYNEALTEIVDYYNAKNDLFYKLMYPIFSSTENFSVVSRFLGDNGDTILSSDNETGKNLIKIWKEITQYDSDVKGILVYKAGNNSLYIYSRLNGIFEKVGSDFPYYDELSGKTSARQLYGARRVDLRMGLEDGGSTMVYGIAGTFYFEALQNNGRCSSIMLLYDTGELNRRLRNYNLDGRARYLLLTDQGNVIFDSAGLYEEKSMTYFGDPGIGAEGEQIIQDGKKFIKTVAVDQRRGFKACYYLPEEVVASSSFTMSNSIFLSIIFFCSLAVFIYFISSHLSGRRIAQLEHGMEQISSNNLGYRIDVGSANDEFVVIAKKFNEMCDELQSNIEKNYLMELRQKTAEFNALQASINPHFLYNALEAVRSKLAESENLDAAEMVVALSRLFEYQTRGGRFSTIREEVEKLKLYISFFHLRYDGSFYVSIKIDESIYRYGIPKYTLQPILENYFVHGIKKGEDNQVTIIGGFLNDEIRLEIRDNGAGIEPARLNGIRERLADKSFRGDFGGIGLINVAERLRITYGEQYGLMLDSDGPDKGTVVTVLIKAMMISELESGRVYND